jgi:hypothetical protein
MWSNLTVPFRETTGRPVRAERRLRGPFNAAPTRSTRPLRWGTGWRRTPLLGLLHHVDERHHLLPPVYSRLPITGLLKFKDPDAPAVRREAEEEMGK